MRSLIIPRNWAIAGAVVSLIMVAFIILLFYFAISARGYIQIFSLVFLAIIFLKTILGVDFKKLSILWGLLKISR